MNYIKEDIFRKQLKKGLSGGYLFFGDEDYMKNFDLNAARKAVCPDETFAIFNDISIDYLNYSASALLDALIPPPMMTDQKIVTVSGLNINDLRASEVDDLCSVLAELPKYDYNVLILSAPEGQFDVGNLNGKVSTAYAKLSKHLTPVLFEPISGARLVAWVGKHFEHHGVAASPAVCESLINYCGRSMFTLSAETEKLAYYVLWNGRTEVTAADVQNVSIPEISAGAFALTNAIIDGNNESAMKALEVMKFRRVEPVIILSEVSKSISDMVMVKALLSEGLPASEITSRLKLHDFLTRKYIAGVSSKSAKRLERALMLCSEADLAIKQSGQGYIPIERLICSL